MRKLIKREIKKIGTMSAFCEKHDIRMASLYDFLNGKTGIETKTLEKMLSVLGLSISKELPEEIEENDFGELPVEYLERFSQQGCVIIGMFSTEELTIIVCKHGKKGLKIFTHGTKAS